MGFLHLAASKDAKASTIEILRHSIMKHSVIPHAEIMFFIREIFLTNKRVYWLSSLRMHQRGQQQGTMLDTESLGK